MKTNVERYVLVLAVFALIIGAQGAFALLVGVSPESYLGCDYPEDRPVDPKGRPWPLPANWPEGMDKLVNVTNRVLGYYYCTEDVSFFSGGASELTAFLGNYSLVEGVESHCLILHDGIGETKSPWEKTRLPCDWKLYASPKGWHDVGVPTLGELSSDELRQKAAKKPGYVLEVHFWTNGPITLDQVDIPKNVVIRKE